jgi:hypothetical protein
MHSKYSILIRLGLGCILVGLMSCQSIGGNNLNDDDATAIKDIFNRETEASVIGMSLSETVLIVDFAAPVVKAQSTDLRVTQDSRSTDSGGLVYLQGLNPGCRTVSAGAETDTDKDGVPDDVTYRFDPLKCERKLLFNRTRTLSGQVRLQDVNPTVKDGNYLETSSNFSFLETISGTPSFAEVRNGTRSLVTLNTLSLTRENNLTTRLERRFRADAELVNQMRLTFTSSGGAVAINQPLPQGAIELSGGVQLKQGNLPLRGFSVTTETALQYSPDCASQRITGGVVVLRSTGGAVRIMFGACGSDPTASIVP